MNTLFKRSKHPIDMTSEQLREQAKAFKNISLSDLRPLTPEMRAQWESAKRGRGRPRKLVKAARVLTTIDPELLAKADAVAKKAELDTRGIDCRGVANGDCQGGMSLCYAASKQFSGVWKGRRQRQSTAILPTKAAANYKCIKHNGLPRCGAGGAVSPPSSPAVGILLSQPPHHLDRSAKVCEHLSYRTKRARPII
jgi:hypothetical protein